MSLRDKVTSLTAFARQHPGYVVLGIFGLFLLNLAVFFFSVNNFPRNNPLNVTLLSTHLLWPIVLIIFGIFRLRQGTSTDEAEIKHRREVTLRYFAIGNLCLLTVLIIVWRYTVMGRRFYAIDDSLTTVLLTLIFSELFVLITWYWVKYSNNRLSASLNNAPRHYLFSIAVFVMSLICYIAYTDLRDYLSYLPAFILADTPRIYTSLMLLFQAIAWIGVFAAIGAAVLGYLRPSSAVEAVTGQENNEKQDKRSVRAESPGENKHDVELSPPNSESINLERLISVVKSNNSKITSVRDKELFFDTDVQ